MQFIPIPTSKLTVSEATSGTDALKPLVAGEAISDVFHQLLMSIQALQFAVTGGGTTTDAKFSEEMTVDGAADVAAVIDEAIVDRDATEEQEADVADGNPETVAVNVDVPKGLQEALDSLKAAIQTRKELATWPTLTKVATDELKVGEPMPARVALEKLNELLLGFEQGADGDEAVEDGEPLLSKKFMDLGEIIKPVTLDREAVKLQAETSVELPRAATAKSDAAPISSAGPVSGETVAVKESSQTPETQATSRPTEPPTVRTVGDFTVRSIRHLLGNEQESIQIRMVPRSLGELHIAVTASRDGIDVVVTAASGLVRDVLESQLAGLRDALHRDGIDISKITVHNSSLSNLGGQLAQSQSQAAQRQIQNSQHGTFAMDADEAGELLMETAVAGGTSRGRSHDGDLDLRA